MAAKAGRKPKLFYHLGVRKGFKTVAARNAFAKRRRLSFDKAIKHTKSVSAGMRGMRRRHAKG